MKKILLYSGGLDSLCAKHILEKRGEKFVPVYFYFKTPYADKELEAIQRYNAEVAGDDNKIEIRRLECLDNTGFKDYHIPFRNALLIMFASLRDVESKKEKVLIYFPQILEVGRDKNTLWEKTLNILFRIHGYKVKVKRPFKYTPKRKMIELSGLSKEFIDRYSYSCHNGVDDPEKECGKCVGCTEKQRAFYRAGMSDRDADYWGRLRQTGWNPLQPVYIFDIFVVLKMYFEELRAYLIDKFRKRKL